MPDLDKLLAAIDAAEENAYGSDNDGGLAADRALLINLYVGQNVDPAPEGRSQVVDRSVFETIQWILPSLCRIYASGSDLVSVPPLGPDDEDAAKQEAEFINHVIQDRNPWFELFNTWSTDALLTRNAYFMAYMDKKRITEVEKYERQTEAGVAMLLQEEGVEVVGSQQYPSDEPPQVDPMTGQPMPPEMLYDLEIRRVKENREVTIRVLPPERVKVSQYTPSYRLNECDYFEFYEDCTLSKLRADGFDVPDDIASDEESYDTEEDQARDLYTETRDDQQLDPSMRRVRARMIWIRHDYDEDGIAELQYVLRVGREILYREEVGSIPVACSVPSPLPHRHIGMSIGDMVADIQRIKTAILRQGLDNLYLSNNPQKVINQNVVNLDDVMKSIPGGVTRVDGDIDAIRYEKHPFVFPEAMQGLEYMDQIRENRTGTNRYFTGIDQNSMNKTATGIQTLSTMAAQRVEQIARILGSGIEDLARIVHELILKSGHKTEVVRLRGQWVEVDPATWRKRGDFKIAVGFASGNKDAMVQRLMMILQTQMQAIEMGIPIAQPQNIHETVIELTKAGDFASPERFWTDPAKVEQAPPPPDPQMVKTQGDLAAKEAELNLKQEETAAEIQLKEMELQLKQYELQAKLELEKYKIDKQAETQIALAQFSHESALIQGEQSIHGEREKEKFKAESKEQAEKPAKEAESAKEDARVSALMEAVKSLKETLSKPRKVVRGKDGRIEGVQ
jgi:hypothetical protein